MCACVSVHKDISRTTCAIFTKFLYMLPMAVAQSSSSVIAIHYVLPVLWMTSRFSIMGRIAGLYDSINFATNDRFRLNLLIYHKARHNSISYY